MSKTQIYGALAMAGVVVISNILVQFLLGTYLTYGAFTYPFAFLVTDLMNRLEGPKSARRVVFVGFVIGLICSFIASQIEGEFGPLVTLRVAVGSATAFLTAQLLDITLFNRLRKSPRWWMPPALSSFLSSALDSLIFFSIAFASSFAFIEAGSAENLAWANEPAALLGIGTMMALWVSMMLADYLVKLGVALIALIPYRATLKAIGALA